jgi:hypothetical protein
MKNILDQAIELREAEKKVTQADLAEIFARDVSDKLAPLTDLAPGWLKQIREYQSTVASTIAKVNRTPFANDDVISKACSALQSLSANDSSVSIGLDEYSKLTPKVLLTPKGEINVNKANQLVFRIRALLRVGDCQKAMEGLVAKIEHRIGELLKQGEYARGSVAPVHIIEPKPTSPEPGGAVVGTFDPRFRT